MIVQMSIMMRNKAYMQACTKSHPRGKKMTRGDKKQREEEIYLYKRILAACKKNQ